MFCFGTKIIRINLLLSKALIASNTEKPIVKLLINRHNNKYSYTGASDDNILKNIELFDKLSLRFSNRVRKGYFILFFLIFYGRLIERFRLFPGAVPQGRDRIGRDLLLELLRAREEDHRGETFCTTFYF